MKLIRNPWLLLPAFPCVVLLACTGCPTDGGGDNTNMNGGSSAPQVNIVSPTLDRDIPAGQTFTIVYSATNSPTEVIAFLDLDGDPTNGNELVFAEGLSGGTEQTVNLDTAVVGLGTYTIGVRAANAGGTTTQYATDGGNLVTVRVNGLPQPAVNSPTSDLEVLLGSQTSVDIVFNCNDFEDEVAWRVFYDTNQFIDGSETTIEQGSGNTAPSQTNQTVQWLTLGVPEGTFRIGVTCTDSADSSSTTYAAGSVTVTSQLSIPTIQVTEPAETIVVFADQDVTIEFAVSDPTASDASVTVFLDTNQQLDQDESEINLAINLLPSATQVTVNSSIIPDSPQSGYFVGAFVEVDGERSVAYAPGRLVVVGVGNLTVSQPADPITVSPGTDVRIAWSTNIPNGQGLVDVALFESDAGGAKGSAVVPDPLEDQKDLEISPNSATLDTLTLDSGFYVAEVTLTPVDQNDVPTGDPISTALSAPIRITTLPTILWVGSIPLNAAQEADPPLGHFDGVIFEGFNFEDNAGSSLLGLGEGFPLGGGFVIGARYAKPFFTNPNGIGSGEAYLVYSDIARINRSFSLNAVGTKLSAGDEDPDALAGLRFSGIAFDQTPEDYNGDGVINIYSEDVDGDGELDVFEDLSGDGELDVVEDFDQDGSLDRAEDGFVGVDADIDGVPDGVINNPAERFSFNQFENGALDVNVSEDRDTDGMLDAVGDATWGLTHVSILPDVDGDELPELCFSFEFTDSLESDFRRQVFGEVEPPNFGDLTQENQFERGGIIIVPSSDEGTISNPFQLGRDEDRVVQLDFVGMDFDESPEDADEDDDDQDTTGIPPPGSDFPPGARPNTGMDVFPWVSGALGAGGNPNFCAADEIELIFFNHLSIDYPVQARYLVTDEDGDQDELIITATTGSYVRHCEGIPNDGSITLVPNGVFLVNPDVAGAPVVQTAFDNRSAQGPFLVATRVIQGITGGLFSGVANDSELPIVIGSPTCSIGSDSCDETMRGPSYGFSYAANATMDSPTHPLAYRRTLANPSRRADEFLGLNQGCGDCGRVFPNITMSTGFYPGEIGRPVGARILGQRAGDRFGSSVSRSRSATDRRVFAGSPQRTEGGKQTAGVVYQFKMESFWNSANDLAGLNDFDVPKPHQYIVKEVGSFRPDGLFGPQRTSLTEAIVYFGADAGDRLGTAVLGITDFNGDVLSDLVMGAPGADGKSDQTPDSGAVYVVYRQTPDLEASVSLDKLELDPSNPNRLNGLLINGDADDQLGMVISGNCDLNDDGRDDLVLGNPLHGAGQTGEVVIVWGGPNLASPANGYSIQEVVDLGRAVRIQGVTAGDQAGFSVACDGDFDGDGNEDLIISAPSAVPQYDSNGDDQLDSPGLDLNRDGVEDGLVADVTDAGLVYVILNTGDLSGTINLSEMGGMIRGFIFAGRRGGDQMGGGFETKRSTRSQGIAYAGDINGDGRDDLLMSSILADPIGSGVRVTNAGEVYLVFGFNEDQAIGFLQEEEGEEAQQ